MKKNAAGQNIGAQMVNATTGAAFTGAVTVSVTGDAGTQATGSVGSGACTHEGNGYHTYAPAQAETNYDLVAFTFTGTGAIPVTVQVYTSFPQTGDGFARLGAPSGASIAADLVTIDDFLDTEIAAIKAKTDNLPVDPADASDIAAAFATVNTSLGTIDDFLDTEIAAIKAKTDNLPAAPAAVSDIPTAAANADAVWDEARSGHTTTGTFGESYAAIEAGQCITGTLSTTAATTNLTEATNDHYIGRTIVWITGVLARQASAITDYDGATKTLTYALVTDAPANGDRFVLV